MLASALLRSPREFRPLPRTLMFFPQYSLIFGVQALQAARTTMRNSSKCFPVSFVENNDPAARRFLSEWQIDDRWDPWWILISFDSVWRVYQYIVQ